MFTNGRQKTKGHKDQNVQCTGFTKKPSFLWIIYNIFTLMKYNTCSFASAKCYDNWQRETETSNKFTSGNPLLCCSSIFSLVWFF